MIIFKFKTNMNFHNFSETITTRRAFSSLAEWKLDKWKLGISERRNVYNRIVHWADSNPNQDVRIETTGNLWSSESWSRSFVSLSWEVKLGCCLVFIWKVTARPCSMFIYVLIFLLFGIYIQYKHCRIFLWRHTQTKHVVFIDIQYQYWTNHWSMSRTMRQCNNFRISS